MSSWFETTPLHEQLRWAAKNVEDVRRTGLAAHLAGWEHRVMREAAKAIEAGTATTTEIGVVHESAVANGDLPTPSGSDPQEKVGI